MTTRNWQLALCAATLLAAGCSSGGSVSMPVPVTSPVPAGPNYNTQFVAKIAVPSPTSIARRPADLSPSAQSLQIALQNGTTIAVMDLSPQSTQCTTASGTRTCTAGGTVPTGAQTFALTAYDQPGGKGNVVSRGTATATIGAGTANTVQLSLNGTVASVALSLSNAHPPAGSAASVSVNVAALDADGNTIVGPYDKPIVLSDADTSGATTLSATSVTASGTAVTLAYSGKALSSATISATVGGTPVTATFAPTPTITNQYNIPDFAPPRGRLEPAGVSELCQGSDGNMWATASAGAIEKILPNGNVTTYPVPATSFLWINGIACGGDGNVWFTEENGNSIGRITPAGAVTQYPLPVRFSRPEEIAQGPDNAMWFVEYHASQLGRLSYDGKLTEFPLPSKSIPTAVAAGPNGNLYVTSYGLNAVLAVSTAGKVLATYPLLTPKANPVAIVVGPDKNLWIAEYNVDKIARMTLSGAVQEFSVPTAEAGVLDLTAGPDGNIWFAESGGGFNVAGKVGYITPDGATIREFPTLSGQHVRAVAFDRAGTLWFSEWIPLQSPQQVGTLVY